MRNSLTNIIPEATAREMVALGLEDSLPKLSERLVNDFARFLHPDVNLDADPVLRARMTTLLTTLTKSSSDLQSEVGLKVAVKRLMSLSARTQMRDEAAAERQQEQQRVALGAALTGFDNIDQFQVLKLKQPTTLMLLANGARLVLNVMRQDKTAMLMSMEDQEVLPPEQPDRLLYENGKWTEVYLDAEGTSAKEKRFVHKLNPYGPVTVVGFIPASAMDRYRQEMPLPSGDSFAELGEGLPMNFSLQWSMPLEAWFLPYFSSTRQSGAEVVVRNRQGMLALAGTVLAEAILPQVTRVP